jgi:hypothetical protein
VGGEGEIYHFWAKANSLLYSAVKYRGESMYVQVCNKVEDLLFQVDQVRAQSNDRIQKLTEEVHALEMDNSEKQDNLEKAIREKRAAESELEKVSLL